MSDQDKSEPCDLVVQMFGFCFVYTYHYFFSARMVSHFVMSRVFIVFKTEGWSIFAHLNWQYASLCKWVRCIDRIASVFPWHRSVSSISLSNAPIPASLHLFYDCSQLQNNTYQRWYNYLPWTPCKIVTIIKMK